MKPKKKSEIEAYRGHAIERMDYTTRARSRKYPRSTAPTRSMNVVLPSSKTRKRCLNSQIRITY